MTKMEEILNTMQQDHNETVKHIAQELQIPTHIAQDVAYLRTRSRHTPEMEAELIRLRLAGVQLNLMEWPPSDSPLRKGQSSLLDLAISELGTKVK
jgi:hypothetical protein